MTRFFEWISKLRKSLANSKVNVSRLDKKMDSGLNRRGEVYDSKEYDLLRRLFRGNEKNS